MGDLTKNFSRREFACHCCGEVKVDMRLVEALQKLRDLAGVPIRVVSGYRCPKHNAEVGGARNSYHLQGKAADIVIEGLDVYRMALLAEQIDEFRSGGLGIYPDVNPPFIHVDVRDARARWAKVGGKYTSIAAAIGGGAYADRES